MNLKIDLKDFLPKFVTLEEAFQGLKDKELIFNRCWSFLFPILTETNVDDLMDVEKHAQNAVISVKHSSRFSFEKTEEPNLFDLFCLDINKLKDSLEID
jgi:hypothetical protein